MDGGVNNCVARLGRATEPCLEVGVESWVFKAVFNGCVFTGCVFTVFVFTVFALNALVSTPLVCPMPKPSVSFANAKAKEPGTCTCTVSTPGTFRSPLRLQC